MCRLMFAASPESLGVNLIKGQMDTLERLMGGDGNGIALLRSGEIIKGLEVTTEELAGEVVDANEPFIFHTRRATVGDRSDKLCQPFSMRLNDEIVEGADGRVRTKRVPPIIVAHNGHWGDYRVGLRYLMSKGELEYVPTDLSDTLVAAMLARRFGPGIFKHVIGSGVWLYSARRGDFLRVLAYVETGDFALNFSLQQAMSEPVGWRSSDTIFYAGAGSVWELYPEMKCLQGPFSNKPLKKKK